MNCNGKVAVRCYRFTSIPATREEELSIKFNINDWTTTLRITHRNSLSAPSLIRKDSRFTEKVMNRSVPDGYTRA
jgi:hypothetical protein